MAEPKDDPFSSHPDWNFRPPKPMGGLLDPSTVPPRRHPQTRLLAGPPPANANKPPAPPQATPSYSASSEDQDYHGRNRWPVLTGETRRRKSILGDTPALFQVKENPNASGSPAPLTLPGLAAQVVRRHDSLIEEEAKKAGVDPDLVRAIMYMEVSQGGIYGYPAESKLYRHVVSAIPVLNSFLPAADSILPMNVRRSLWEGLLSDGQPFSRRYIEAGRDRGVVIDEGEQAFNDPRLNIRAGVTLLKRIEDRLEKPTLRNIATLYNDLGENTVNNYGARVEQIYRTREWEKQRAAPGRIVRGPQPPY